MYLCCGRKPSNPPAGPARQITACRVVALRLSGARDRRPVWLTNSNLKLEAYYVRC